MRLSSRLEPLFSIKGALASSLVCVVAAFVAGGEKAAAGMALALFSVSMNIAVLARITSFLARRANSERPLWPTLFLVAALMVKLPLFVFFVFLAYRMGGTALSGFGAGILLVYSALVGWSLFKGGD